MTPGSPRGRRAGGETSQRDPRDTSEHAGVRELLQKPIDAVGGFADVLEKQQFAARINLPWCAAHRCQYRKISARDGAGGGPLNPGLAAQGRGVLTCEESVEVLERFRCRVGQAVDDGAMQEGTSAVLLKGTEQGRPVGEANNRPLGQVIPGERGEQSRQPTASSREPHPAVAWRAERFDQLFASVPVVRGEMKMRPQEVWQGVYVPPHSGRYGQPVIQAVGAVGMAGCDNRKWTFACCVHSVHSIGSVCGSIAWNRPRSSRPTPDIATSGSWCKQPSTAGMEIFK